MAVLEIFIDETSVPFSEQVELEGEVFTLNFQFNDRDQAWYFDIEDFTGVPIRSGVKIVSDFPLTRLLASQERPAGEFIGTTTTVDDRDPLEEDLGSRVLFTYVESTELE